MKNIISIENVSFAYNKENVLQDIILSIDEGDFVIHFLYYKQMIHFQ